MSCTYCIGRKLAEPPGRVAPILFLVLLGLGVPKSARSQINAPLISSVLTTSQIQALVTTLAIAYEHRAYSPATPLGTNFGLEAGLEATAVKVPDTFTAALASLGAGSALPLPVFPAVKIAAHKGLGSFDVGVSGLWYLGSYFVGGDLKLCIFNPPEGINVALRANYNYLNLILLSPLLFHSHIISGEILISRNLGKYFDPYIGAGFHYALGDISTSLTVTVLGVTQTFTETVNTSGTAYNGFMGVSIILGPTAIRLAAEMAYSSVGMFYAGTKLGIQL